MDQHCERQWKAIQRFSRLSARSGIGTNPRVIKPWIIRGPILVSFRGLKSEPARIRRRPQAAIVYLRWPLRNWGRTRQKLLRSTDALRWPIKQILDQDIRPTQPWQGGVTRTGVLLSSSFGVGDWITLDWCRQVLAVVRDWRAGS